MPSAAERLREVSIHMISRYVRLHAPSSILTFKEDEVIASRQIVILPRGAMLAAAGLDRHAKRP